MAKQKKSKADKLLDGVLKDVLAQNMMRSADKKFRELTEHGERSLTVFRKVPYQMVDMGDCFYFVEIPGYITDDPDALDPDAVYNFDALAEKKPLFRKQFTIPKSDIVSAEIGGRYCGYFDRLCGYLILTYRKGANTVTLNFFLPGLNNPFAVREFLGGVEVKINPTSCYKRGGRRRFLDLGEESTIGALLKYFNRKGRAINTANWILSAVSFLLIFINAVFNLPYRDVMRGVAALLPLLIYGNYIKYHHLLSLFVTGFGRKSPYHKRKPECFGKIAVPAVALLMSEMVDFTFLVSFRQYFVLAFALGFMMTLLYDFFVPRVEKAWLRRGLACGALCFFYAFMAVIPVNRLWVRQVDSRVLDYPSSSAYEKQSRGETFRYCWVNTADGTYTWYVSPQEYERLEKHELSARADKYRGLLGISYYEFELVEASEEARQRSAFLESMPSLPPNPTAENMEKYRRQSQALLARLQELAEQNGLSVSGSDMN